MAARQALMQAIERQAAVIILAGAPGTGKTELLGSVAAELSGAAVRIDRGGRLQEAADSDADVLLIDEATDLSEAGRAQLAERAGLPGKSTVVTLVDADDPTLRDLARSAVVVTLSPFARADACAFTSSLKSGEITDAAIGEIARRSRGVPRLVRSLVSSSGIEAQIAGAGIIDADHVREAARHLMLPEPLPEEPDDGGEEVAATGQDVPVLEPDINSPAHHEAAVDAPLTTDDASPDSDPDPAPIETIPNDGDPEDGGMLQSEEPLPVAAGDDALVEAERTAEPEPQEFPAQEDTHGEAPTGPEADPAVMQDEPMELRPPRMAMDPTLLVDGEVWDDDEEDKRSAAGRIFLRAAVILILLAGAVVAFLLIGPGASALPPEIAPFVEDARAALESLLARLP